MCGICGFNWKNEALVTRMTETIHHRGPDQDGIYCDEHVSLGHRRLSIIDLSEHGRQPLGNEDGSIQVTYNGEIYNFQEIKDDLIAKGHVFHGKSDTEILVHGYEEYGYDLLQKMNGMFAFAIWDRNKQRIWIARDRIGIKPLYYYCQNGKFIFASEIKAILEDPEVPRIVNKQAIYRYLCFEFVPAPETMFAGIHKVPAGHYAVYENGQIALTNYWDIQFNVPEKPQPIAEIVEQERYLIEQAVRRRLLSDVPLGAFLSGGLDSSAIVAMMRKHNSGRLRTFTIGYKDKTFSELDYAQIVADRFETDHQVLMIEQMDREAVEKSLWHLDEPMTDLSSIPLMFICEQAKQHVTVCLSGEGGDEVFAGYDRFKAAKMARYLNIIPKPIREGVLFKLVSRFPDQEQKKGAINMLKRFMEGAALPEEGMHLRWQFFSNTGLENNLYSDSFRKDVTFDPFDRVREYNSRTVGQDRINRQIYADMRFMMTDSVLMKVDKMSMANALEIRVPLLDHTLVEYMATVHGDLKLKGSQTKHIFRKALEGILPDKIVYRGKQGYSLPVKNLLRTQLKDYMIELLNESPLIKECMDLNYVNQLIDEHLSMKHNHNHVLWGMMNIAIWHNRFFR
jgi:asparagine synthase (glutamine-hydrolysing)